MVFLKNLFKPGKSKMMKEYIGVLAHLAPYGKLEKDYNQLIVTLITSNGRSSVNLNESYDTWRDCASPHRSSFLLDLASNHIAAVNQSKN